MESARDELIRMHERWVRELKQRIYSAQERNDPVLDRYYEEYRRLFQQGFKRHAARHALVSVLRDADIAWFGDYHTLKTAQQTVVTLLSDALAARKRPVLLCLEMLHAEHQRHADEFLAGRLTEEQFLSAIDYQRTWGFDWSNFRVFFEFARRHGARIIGLNRTVADKRRSLELRDELCASLVSALTVANPGALVAVVYGDLHIGETHQPRLVREKLASWGIQRRDVIVYQNSETFYKLLVKERMEQVVDAVQVKPGVYCVMNATPLVKFQSWLNWQEQGGELRFTGLDSLGHEYQGETDLSEQFGDIVETIARFLRLDHLDDLEDFELYTTGDLDFIADLVEEGVYAPAEVDAIKELIAVNHSAFFARARTIYLGSLSLNDAAEMAAKYISFVASGSQADPELEERDAFYAAAFEEALGVFGILVMNPRYRVLTFEDHRERVETLSARRRLSASERQRLIVSRHVLQHGEMVRAMVEGTSSRNRLTKIYQLGAAEFRAVTRALGAILGAQLFAAINAGKIGIDLVRQLFEEVWEPGEPFDRYVEVKRIVYGKASEPRAASAAL